MERKGALILEDGTRYEGYLFGAKPPCSGEVVFSTVMTGYTESLSDPSFAGQILVMTYPLIGNYGLPPQKKDSGNGLLLYMEGDRLYPRALVVHDYTDEYSHWNAVESLASGMERYGVTGLTGIDTRALAQRLRDQGSMMGKIVSLTEEDRYPFEAAETVTSPLVNSVSTKEVLTYPRGKKKVVLIDCGVKNSLLRSLLCRDLTVCRVPWNYDFFELDFDGVCISNGPGDPHLYSPTIENIKRLIEKEIPILGIGMGNLLLGLALGLRVEKMKVGHRSANQPVRRCGTHKCLITAQNQGYVLLDSPLPEGWQRYFTHLNDQTNAGLIHESLRYSSVQFDPLEYGQTSDTSFVIDQFVNTLSK